MNDAFAPNIGQPRGAAVMVDMGPSEFVTGDATGDGRVDVDDLITVILTWGNCTPTTLPCAADLNRSGAVNVDDLVIMLLNWR